MIKLLSVTVCMVLSFSVAAQDKATIPVGENLFVEGIPALDQKIIEEVKPYTESRGAGFSDWHPGKKEMLVTTRFGNTNQVHIVKGPGMARKQLTFFDEPVSGATFEPVKGNYFLFLKDVGGNEFRQIYRYDLESGKSTLLTDGGRSQNGNIKWNDAGTRILYTSSVRNGKDRDVYIMDPLKPEERKILIEGEGGGWSIADWRKDEKQVLLNNYKSINETEIWLYDIASGKKSKLLPVTQERTVYSGIKFDNTGEQIYIATNKGREFTMPAKLQLKSMKVQNLVDDINWEIENYEISKDFKRAAFTSNEAGISKLYIQDLSTFKYKAVNALPVGIISNLEWHDDNNSLGLTYGSSNTAADVYEYDVRAEKITRWTESETGGMNTDWMENPQLIKWKSFDGTEISGFLYKANKKFTGKRPVIINIHGGPEAQFKPSFIGRNNYYLNELGISIIFPNVRGSDGFGKTYLDMDNGYKREESVKDIGALLDWIEKEPALDASRIMVTGGSYGGYMTLAAAVHYNDRIKCAVDIVGISNFNTFLKNTENYRRDLRRVEYGDERDTAMSAFFERISPLNNADKIKKPLFVIQGKNDPRVPYTEAQQMVERIRKNGGLVWYLMANDEGHGFQKKTNQDYQFYATVEFIKQYLLK